ncbi:BON domain-containing protein [Chitinophaga sp. XS-30]|uniref:BON domain-containing protein n=1 Tax=Chitinophaga sp. XS-30 TaxID=2604421 RepID=UPI0011DD1D88|nr:BON domain-containing protein [Chitinophaga sp. XS-30]QEH42677.1 BON domain-containing protein [Chitinophaga sp. XS-30]
MKKTDIQLQKDVMEELQWEPSLEASGVGVAVKDGIVTLSGTIANYSQKLAAENAAKRVKGVRAVAVDLEVRLSTGEKRNDADIAEAVLNALKWNSFVPEEKIRIKVDDGWLTIEGEVEWGFQRESVTNAVKDLLGVKGVRNLLSIRPVIAPSIVRDRIKKALSRRANVESEGIDVQMDGGHVTLKGNVRSWSEREEVERAVWSAPGVLDVKDELVVTP